MKKTFRLIGFLLMAVMSFGMVACGGDSDDDDSGGGGGGGSSMSGKWYINSTTIPDKANDISSTLKGCVQAGYTNSSSYFDSDGKLHFFSYVIGNTAYAGEEVETVGRLISIHIINNNMLEAFFDGRTYKLYGSGAAGKQLLYSINVGSILGTVGIYAESSRYYTYYSDGDSFWFGDENIGIFEFANYNGELYENGGGKWVEYDPMSTYNATYDAYYSPTKHYLYGENPITEPPFSPGVWDAAAMRFSSTEGAHLPTIPDEVYDGLKTLIFEVSDVSPDFDLKVMNGWWSNTYYDHVKWVDGLNEIKITETMARE